MQSQLNKHALSFLGNCRGSIEVSFSCEIDVSRRFTITIPDSIYDELARWADHQGRATANLAAYLVEVGINQAREKGDIPPPKEAKVRQEKR